MFRKALLLAVFCVLANYVSSFAQVQIEGSAKGIFAKQQITLLQGDTEIALQDALGFSFSDCMKEIGISALVGGQYRLKYFLTLPINKSGSGPLGNRILINGIAFGPKEKDAKKTKEVSTELSFVTHRAEVEVLTRYTLVSPVAFVEYRNVKMNMKDMESSIEATEAANKFLVGGGIAGYYRAQNALLRYEAVYFMVDKKSGIFADTSIRYDWRNMFVGGGYRYQKADMAFGAGDLKLLNQGPYLEVGLWF